ncbi:MAG: hypothetical protein AAF909_15310 [Pseudomonadota bacterium]
MSQILAPLRRRSAASRPFGPEREATPVYGCVAPEPRITWEAVRLAALYLGAPLIALLDALAFLIGWAVFDACWAVWCWL